MKRPLTGLVVTYATGIWVGSWIGGPVGWSCAVAAALMGLFFYFRWALLLWAVVLCAGVWSYRVSTTNAAPEHITHLLTDRDQNVSLRGVILDDPGYRDVEEDHQRHSFKLRLEALKRADVWEPAGGTVLVFVSATRDQAPLRYGDEIECSALLRVPPSATNPGTFDWRRWLALKNIQFTAMIRELDECRVLATGRGNPILALAQRLREHCEHALRVGLEDEPRLAGVLAGMVIGERSDIPADTYADFQQTGVFHVFAISGLHVGIVTLVVVTLLRLVRVPRRWCGLIAIPVLILYVFATGARPGAIRALVMAAVWLGGWMLLRPTDALSNLAAAALILLVWQPTELFDGAFLLSFVVVLALVLITPRVEERLQSWVGVDPLVPEELVPNWRRALAGPLRWGVTLVSCSFVAWIGLLPLMALYFHLFTPVSLIANLLVVPLVGVIIPVGMLSAALPALSATLNNANFFLLEAMIHGVNWLGQWQWGHWFVQAPPVWWIIAYYVCLLAWVARWLKLRWLMIPVAATLILAAWPDGAAEITVLDLRDGVAVFVNLPGKANDWLIDGGSDWSGARVVLPYLRGQGVNRLAAAVATHGDKAHAAGLDAVAQQVPIRQAIHAGTGARSKYFWEWLETMRGQRAEIVALRAGAKRRLGKLTIRVLNPPAGEPAKRGDDNSLVLMLDYGATRVLLASDIGASVEQQLAATGGVQAQVLIKGRHSQEASGTEAFLDAVRPEVVIQSVGARLSDRYLQPELHARLRLRGTKFYRTDESGAVTVRLTDSGYTIRTCFEGVDAAR